MTTTTGGIGERTRTAITPSKMAKTDNAQAQTYRALGLRYSTIPASQYMRGCPGYLCRVEAWRRDAIMESSAYHAHVLSVSNCIEDLAES